jgi:hypothetical protein
MASLPEDKAPPKVMEYIGYFTGFHGQLRIVARHPIGDIDSDYRSIDCRGQNQSDPNVAEIAM